MFENRNQLKKNKWGAEQTELRGVINLIISKGMGPCICFAFSKSECENFAWVLSKCEYTTDENKEAINLIFSQAIGGLS